MPSFCTECRSTNRSGLLFCVVCGRRLPREGLPPESISAATWPGPEVPVAVVRERPSALAWASLLAALLAWSVLPVVGAAMSILLALRAQEEANDSGCPERGTVVLRAALWLGGAQLVLALVACAAMGTVALVAFVRGG